MVKWTLPLVIIFKSICRHLSWDEKRPIEFGPPKNRLRGKFIMILLLSFFHTWKAWVNIWSLLYFTKRCCYYHSLYLNVRAFGLCKSAFVHNNFITKIIHSHFGSYFAFAHLDYMCTIFATLITNAPYWSLATVPAALIICCSFTSKIPSKYLIKSLFVWNYDSNLERDFLHSNENPKRYFRGFFLSWADLLISTPFRC